MNVPHCRRSAAAVSASSHLTLMFRRFLGMFCAISSLVFSAFFFRWVVSIALQSWDDGCQVGKVHAQIAAFSVLSQYPGAFTNRFCLGSRHSRYRRDN
jgi:hypothetical protein